MNKKFFALVDTNRAEFIGTVQEVQLLSLNTEDSVFCQLRSQGKIFDRLQLLTMPSFIKVKPKHKHA